MGEGYTGRGIHLETMIFSVALFLSSPPGGGSHLRAGGEEAKSRQRGATRLQLAPARRLSSQGVNALPRVAWSCTPESLYHTRDVLL